ncbi:FMN-dependent NADH-azoreductase [Ramlibacter sp.]|uniref:FMN-dependent NADH-azoreductase n=1 Tax=Ramlibacter sp. TaxID=1917967 RepID=UPI002FC6102D
MKLLHIDSSALGGASASRQLTAQLAREWVQAHPGTTVEHLDLVAAAPSHLDEHSLGFRLGVEATTERQRQENALSERLVNQFLAADVVVVGAPMYNFSIPSQLKAWIDRIAQAGRTFRYTAAGPEGLAGGKTVVVVSSRGGAYAGMPHEAAMDHQESYLRAVFGFFGITDVRIVRAEGLAMGDEGRATAMAAAGRDIRALFDAPANEAQRLAA